MCGLLHAVVIGSLRTKTSHIIFFISFVLYLNLEDLFNLFHFFCLILIDKPG